MFRNTASVLCTDPQKSTECNGLAEQAAQTHPEKLPKLAAAVNSVAGAITCSVAGRGVLF